MTTPIDEAAKALNDEHRRIWPGAGFFAKPEALQIAQAAIQAHTAAVLRGTDLEYLVQSARAVASGLGNESGRAGVVIDKVCDAAAAQAAALAVERGKVEHRGECVVVPVSPGYETLSRLADAWGYDIEEAADNYATLIRVAPVPTQYPHVEQDVSTLVHALRGQGYLGTTRLREAADALVATASRLATLEEFVELCAENGDSGRGDGLPEVCPANEAALMWHRANELLALPTPPTPAPLGDGWIELRSSAQPVSDDTEVLVKLRDGTTFYAVAEAVRWATDRIIAYKLASLDEQMKEKR